MRQVGCKTTPRVISVAFVGNYVVRDPIRTVHVIVGPGVLLLAAMLKRGQLGFNTKIFCGGECYFGF